MKTYDIYAKQNGKWQRKGIQGGSTLPEYDGTVIIEKAESALGLRRFKETITPLSTISASASVEEYETFYNTYSFDIEPVVIQEQTLSKLSCGFTFSEDTSHVVLGLYVDGSWVSYSTVENINAMIDSFVISSTANSTVDEWLLANTEGVSV